MWRQGADRAERYLLIDYYLAELTLRDTTLSRQTVLHHAQDAFERFLALLDTYRLLSKGDSKLYETYLDDRTSFTTAAGSDPSARRDTKIARFRQETDLKCKLEVCFSVDLFRSFHVYLTLCAVSFAEPQRRQK